VTPFYMREAIENKLMTAKEPSLALVIPAYNESVRIAQTLADAWTFLASQQYNAELIVVDDGSTDTTAEIARQFIAENPGPVVVTIPHGGKAAALRAGMLLAECDHVAFTDADLATPLSYLSQLRDTIANGCDIAIGSREGVGARRIGEPFHRHFMGRIFNGLVRTFVLKDIQDTQCGFKLFTKGAASELLKRSLLYTEPGMTVTGPRVTAYDVELLVIARRLGLKIGSVPVVWTFGAGSSVNPIRDTLQNLKDIAQVKWYDVGGRYNKPAPRFVLSSDDD
jgi:dolichyl-phosphate beta-glucosyltransferase